MTLAIAAAGLLRSSPWLGPASPPATAAAAVPLAAVLLVPVESFAPVVVAVGPAVDEGDGIPPVAWAAANKADIEDIGSEEEGEISRPAALAASKSEEEEGGPGGPELPFFS